MTISLSWLEENLERGNAVAILKIAEARGSTPREQGATMLMTSNQSCGTIGGGRLEFEAMAHARTFLQTNTPQTSISLPLGPETGQCCGGHVSINIHRASKEDVETLQAEIAQKKQFDLWLFGAGHVGKAVAKAVDPLPFRLNWVDERKELFPVDATAIVNDHPATLISNAGEGSAFLVMTHCHALDFDICCAVMKRADFLYLGLIGSKTKRARFESGFRALGLNSGNLTCPIGGSDVQDKRPEIIAALVAAELISVAAREKKI